MTEIVPTQGDKDAVSRRLYLLLDSASGRANWEYEAKQILEPAFAAHRLAVIEACAKVAEGFIEGDHRVGLDCSATGRSRRIATAIRRLSGETP